MLSSMTGCDSLVTLDLTIDNSLIGTDAQSACDSYTWIDGVTYTPQVISATLLLEQQVADVIAWYLRLNHRNL